jgi:pseudouridine-5'-phosphate glycosidase/pseudouridine kinase
LRDTTKTTNLESSPSPKINPPEVLVFGAAAIDITSRISSGSVESAMHTTAPGHLEITPGGVGRNIAECASRMSHGEGKVMLVSAVGAQGGADGTEILDSFGLILDREMRVSGMRTDGLLKRLGGAEGHVSGGARTAVCNLILDDKAGLVIGVADMDIVESITIRDVSDGLSIRFRRCLIKLSPTSQIREALDLHQPKTVAFDANLAPEVITSLLEQCYKRHIVVIHDPTSLPKMLRLLPAIQQHQPVGHQHALITHYTPNILELKTLYDALRSKNLMETEHWWAFIDSLQLDHNWRNVAEQFARKSGQKWIGEEGVVQMMVSLLPWVENLWLKCGDKGIVYLGLQPPTTAKVAGSHSPSRIITKSVRELSPSTSDQQGRNLVLAHFAAKDLPSIVSTTGAGDSFVGGLLAQINDNPDWRCDIGRVIDIAMGCSEKSLLSGKAVGQVEALKHLV